MSLRTRRWMLALATALIASALGAWFLQLRRANPSGPSIAFHEPEPGAERVEFPHVPTEEFFRVDEQAAVATAPEQRRFFLSRAQVASAWGESDPRVVYDPWTYAWDAGGRDDEFPLPEHPRGRWRLTTNAQGLRETGDPTARRCDVRVLATGDSHAFGVCNTDETFASVLEQLLAPGLAPRCAEVLDAAQPGYDAFNYLGVLHRFLAFEPQVFVVLYFGGNDLLSALDTYYRFTREPIPPPPPHEKRRRAEVIGRAPHAFGQCFEGAPFLLAHPEQGELAARVNALLLAEMQAVCRKRGVQFVVAYLPSPCDLEWRDPPAEIARGRELSGLAPDAGSGLRAVEESFLAKVAALSIELVDLRAAFAAQAEPPYWRRDLHLDLAGHRLVAEALAARIRM